MIEYFAEWDNLQALPPTVFDEGLSAQEEAWQTIPMIFSTYDPKQNGNEIWIAEYDAKIVNMDEVNPIEAMQLLRGEIPERDSVCLSGHWRAWLLSIRFNGYQLSAYLLSKQEATLMSDEALVTALTMNGIQKLTAFLDSHFGEKDPVGKEWLKEAFATMPIFMPYRINGSEVASIEHRPLIAYIAQHYPENHVVFLMDALSEISEDPYNESVMKHTYETGRALYVGCLSSLTFHPDYWSVFLLPKEFEAVFGLPMPKALSCSKKGQRSAVQEAFSQRNSEMQQKMRQIKQNISAMQQMESQVLH